MKLLLTAISGSREGKTFTIEDRQCITFGRTGASNWSFEDDGHMSSIHFEVENFGSRAEVRDRGSTNGTWLNNNKIAREPLREGDRIRAGKTVLTVEFCKVLVPAEIVSEDDELESTIAPTPVEETSAPIGDVFSPIASEPTSRAFTGNGPVDVSPRREPTVKDEPANRYRASNPFESVDFENVQSTPSDVLPPASNGYVPPAFDSIKRSNSPISDSSFSFPNVGDSQYELLSRRTTLEAADGLAIILDSLALKWSIQLTVHFQKIRISAPRGCQAGTIIKNAPDGILTPVRVAWNEATTAAILPLMPRLCRADGCIAFLGQSATEVIAQIELMSSIGVEGFSEPNGLLPFFWPSNLMSIIDARGIGVCRDLFGGRISGVIMCSPWSRNKVMAVADDSLAEDLEAAEFQPTIRMIGD